MAFSPTTPKSADCPLCKGVKQITTKDPADQTKVVTRPCPACGGTGVKQLRTK